MDNGNLLVTYGYHVDNTLAQARFSNGITTEYTYDRDKNPASITTTTRTGEKLFAYRYAYDYNGNRILKQDVRELTSGDLQRVGDYGRIGETGSGQVFDGLATGQVRLHGQLPEQVPLTQATRYIYDPLQRIAGVQYADGKEESLAYDSAGNRALRKYGSQEETYRYDSRNRLTEVARKDSTRAENNRITLYQYDNQGNTLQEETKGCTENLLQKSHYDYDGFNKTRKVTVEYFGNEKETPTAVQTQENFYDAENLRYGIVENGERTNFITNGWKVLAEQDESNQTTNRIVLGYGIIASDSLKQEGDGYQYFHWNEHGDTEYITGENGQVLNRYGYDAFGSLTTAEEIVRNRYTYNGEQYDAITSQYYLRARFYNPQVARFTQEDVYRGDGLNLYTYCANNPVMYEDPSGYVYIDKLFTETGTIPGKSSSKNLGQNINTHIGIPSNNRTGSHQAQHLIPQEIYVKSSFLQDIGFNVDHHQNGIWDKNKNLNATQLNDLCSQYNVSSCMQKRYVSENTHHDGYHKLYSQAVNKEIKKIENDINYKKGTGLYTECRIAT
nr:RHS repeat-associated core domain-containing protein [Anaerocolumna cellulosilytica]